MKHLKKQNEHLQYSHKCRQAPRVHYYSNYLSPVKPNIVGGLTASKKILDERDETSIPCQWTGYPDPLVTWYKDGSPLREQDLPFRMRITEDRVGEIFHSSLDIYQVVLNDTGDYICNVSNPVGFDTRIIRLEVQGH